MKKLLLTSAANQTIHFVIPLLSKEPHECRLAFIPTAGDPYGPNKPWMDADRKQLEEMGFQVFDLDLKEKTETNIRKALTDVDVIFVAGGNTYYLLDYVNKSGFGKVVKELVEKGVVYIGSSAGSYIACPTIEASGWKHADTNIVRLEDLTALNFVDFLVIAHYDDEIKDATELEIKKSKYPVITLTDQQAIVVEGDNHTIVGNK